MNIRGDQRGKINPEALQRRVEEINAGKQRDLEMLKTHREGKLIPLVREQIAEGESTLREHYRERKTFLEGRLKELSGQFDDALSSLENQKLLAPHQKELANLTQQVKELKAINNGLEARLSQAKTELESQISTRTELGSALGDYGNALEEKREIEAAIEAATRHANLRKVVDAFGLGGPSLACNIASLGHDRESKAIQKGKAISAEVEYSTYYNAHYNARMEAARRRAAELSEQLNAGSKRLTKISGEGKDDHARIKGSRAAIVHELPSNSNEGMKVARPKSCAPANTVNTIARGPTHHSHNNEEHHDYFLHCVGDVCQRGAEIGFEVINMLHASKIHFPISNVIEPLVRIEEIINDSDKTKALICDIPLEATQKGLSVLGGSLTGAAATIILTPPTAAAPPIAPGTAIAISTASICGYAATNYVLEPVKKAAQKACYAVVDLARELAEE